MNTAGFSLHAGHTFKTYSTTLRDHLWVVVSDPLQNAERIVLANFTSHKFEKDESCVLEAGDHPFIIKRTIVSYADAKIASIQGLSTLHNLNQIQFWDPVAADILLRIRVGMMKSPHSLRGFKKILEEQGLVNSE